MFTPHGNSPTQPKMSRQQSARQPCLPQTTGTHISNCWHSTIMVAAQAQSWLNQSKKDCLLSPPTHTTMSNWLQLVVTGCQLSHLSALVGNQHNSHTVLGFLAPPPPTDYPHSHEHSIGKHFEISVWLGVDILGNWREPKDRC